MLPSTAEAMEVITMEPSMKMGQLQEMRHGICRAGPGAEALKAAKERAI